jgi:hypothetical protein
MPELGLRRFKRYIFGLRWIVWLETQVTCIEIEPTNNNIRIMKPTAILYRIFSSASARISKGQGYRGFIRKRAGSSFGQKRAICIVQGKT